MRAEQATDAVQRLLDEQEIRQVLARYCRGVDRCDAELIRSVYHPDANDNHGTYNGPGRHFPDHVLPMLQATWEATMHNLGTCVIEIDGDTAHVETYFVAYHRRHQGVEPWLDVFGGRYIDRFEKRDHAWLIADRVVVHEWSKLEPTPSTFPAELFAAGQRSPADPAYDGERRP